MKLKCVVCNSDLTGAVAVLGDRKAVDQIHHYAHLRETLDELLSDIFNARSWQDINGNNDEGFNFRLVGEIREVRLTALRMKGLLEKETILKEEENG